MELNERLSRLPQVELLLARPEVSSYIPRLSRPLCSKAAARAVAELRDRLKTDPAYPSDSATLFDGALALLRDGLEALDRKGMRHVLNGTGIVLNTNLGRSPIFKDEWDAVRDANTGYSNLEFSLEEGRRNRRGELAAELAAEVAGAESALVVNNNAAAVLLMLTTLAKGREVLVSRGEQVQIGGGFRIPDILELSGARLVEVGTTNVTTVDDYVRAVTPETALVLVVHSSNFALRGFTEAPDIRRLAEALPEGVILVADQGSGCLEDGLAGELAVRRYLERGCRLVSFSADKLPGGPQAGIVAGDGALVETLARHPLYRAFRPGKTVLSLLERRLAALLNGVASPAFAASRRDPSELRRFGRRLLSRLPRDRARLVPSQAAWGGGSTPDEGFPSLALSLTPANSADRLLAALREAPVPVIGYIREDRVFLDLGTLFGEDPARVAASVSDALARDELSAESPGRVR